MAGILPSTLTSHSECNLCHLRAGHTKWACPNGPCLSAQQCCDIEKHSNENRQKNEANEGKQKISIGLDRHKSEVAYKKKEQVTNKFSGKITSYLINSDRETYAFHNEDGAADFYTPSKF